MWHFFLLFVCSILPVTLLSRDFKTAVLAQGFQKPVGMVFTNKDTYYIVEQTGKLVRVARGKRTMVLDLGAEISTGYELGLLSVAFAPGFREGQNGLFYAYYTLPRPLRSRIAEFGLESGKAYFRRTILEFPQPYSNHNGGLVLFGPDGHLYIGSGDGGSAGDPQNHAQNPGNLLGKILRIQVETKRPYSIPAGNPLKPPAGRPEIFAIGLRNPWRFSFDRKSGRLYAADVGQNSREEINLIEAGRNYGWRILEGELCFKAKTCSPPIGYSAPLHTYGREDGISITGGYVYRGTRHPSIAGHYLYADYGSGHAWALPLNAAGRKAAEPRRLLERAGQISAMAEDPDGEIYFVDHAGRILSLEGKP